jgi:hypothetical protein
MKFLDAHCLLTVCTRIDTPASEKDSEWQIIEGLSNTTSMNQRDAKPSSIVSSSNNFGSQEAEIASYFLQHDHQFRKRRPRKKLIFVMKISLWAMAF